MIKNYFKIGWRNLLRGSTIEDVPDHIAQTRWYSSERPLAGHSDPGCEDEVFIALAQIRQIALALDVTMANLALAWLLAQPGVTSALVGARKPEELGWNLPALDLELDDDIISRLSAITEPVKAKLAGNPDMWMSTSRMR
jgi:aryl-alcohol dehydrogenase-like predicted oxidoreductase